MLFSEIYGSYFNVVAAVLSEASDGKLTDRRMTELVREKAFAESALAIPAALKSGTWPLLDQEYHSILHHKPTMPLTMLQKRWLKALLSDPRIALFDPDTTGLEDVDPRRSVWGSRLHSLLPNSTEGNSKEEKTAYPVPWPYRRPPFDRVYTLPPGIFRQGR